MGLINVIVFGCLAVMSVLVSFASDGVPIAVFIVYCLFVFLGAQSRAKKLTAKIKSNLTADEILISEAFELRPFALFHRRFAVAVTNNRIIFLKRKIFGGFKKIEDWQWKFLFEATIEENNFPATFGATLNFLFSPSSATFSKSPTSEAGFTINGIDSEIASKIYNYATLQKQEWSEKNRIRQMEETRAASGGMTLQGYPQTQTPVMSVVEQKLGEAKSLLDKGFISNAEFQERKSKILGDHI